MRADGYVPTAIVASIKKWGDRMRVEDINSLESEAGVIATLIHHPDFYFRAENLLPKHFTDKENEYTYTAIRELAQRNVQTVDAYNIREALGSSDETKGYLDFLTVDKLNGLIDMSDTLARNSYEEYEMLAGNVIDCAFRRDACKCLERCIQKCKDLKIDDVQKEIYDSVDDVMTSYSNTNSMPLYSEIVEETWAHIKARQRGETKAISFPFPLLNDYVVLEPGECVCFTGGPKAGKSAMLLTVTVSMLKKGKSVLYVDSEISDELFTMRILSHLTGIQFWKIRNGAALTEEEEASIREQIEWLKQQRFIHIYMPVLKADPLYITAKKAKHQIDIDCIVVDYLKADNTKSEGFAVYADLGNVSDVLKNKIAGELGIAALTAAQATSTGKIADSARIARSMSTVVAISDKDLAEVETDGTGATKKIRVVFNRNGEQMSEGEWIDFRFDGSTCKYTQAEKQHQLTEPF